jgi:hypothetical protein
MIGAKKLTWNTWLPDLHVAVSIEPSRAALGLGRDRGVVDQRMQLRRLQPLA